MIINGKNFYDQGTHSDIKLENRKLTTGQGEDYTTGCLLSRQKQLDADPKAI